MDLRCGVTWKLRADRKELKRFDAIRVEEAHARCAWSLDHAFLMFLNFSDLAPLDLYPASAFILRGSHKSKVATGVDRPDY